MIKIVLILILSLIIMILAIILYRSYSTKYIPCLKDNNVEFRDLLLVNTRAKWNCGLKEWNLSKKERDEFCSIFSEFQSFIPNTTQRNYWRIDFYFNENIHDRYDPVLSLSNNVREGMVFKIGYSYYRNAELAHYIIKKMELSTNTGDNTPCN